MFSPRKFYSTRVVVDMETLEIVERDEIPYEGPWALFDGAPADVAPADTGGAPADAGGGDGGGDGAPADGGGSIDDWADEPPADAPPADAPTDGQPAEGDEPPADDQQVDPNAPPAPVKPEDRLAAAQDATLKQVYRDNFGKVQEIIKANPALRPIFFKAAEFNQIYTTVEDAKQAKEWAGQLYQFDNLYYSSKPEDTRSFLNALYENSKEPDGSAPHYDRLASTIVTDAASNLAVRIQQGDPTITRAFSDLGLNGKQAMVAVQAVAAMFGIKLNGVRFQGGGGAPQGGTAPKPGEMSEREQYLAQKVAEANEEIERLRGGALAQTEQNFYNGIQTSFNDKLAADIGKRLEAATALKTQKPGFQNWVKSEIVTRVKNSIRNDSFFANQMEAASRSGDRGPEHQQQMLSALEQRARHYLPDIYREVMAEAGITIQQKTNAASAKAGTPHREPATGGTPGRLSKPGSSSPNARKPGESYDQYSSRVLGIE